MMVIRTVPFAEAFASDVDADANVILTELDKGLRSTKIGEQCAAIVKHPQLFEKYPSPLLINSSFLKLADFYRSSNSNLLRLWVLRVCQQSEKHLEKILNVDEFVKRIFSVIHSNDPVARALTLRTLGAVACVIPEKQQVHHAIRSALDSHDKVEVEAAIYASVQFAAQSKTFAVSMCSKVSDMIETLVTPPDLKLLLIPVLKHMHHDASTAAMVKKLCKDLLPKYPAENFVIVILDTLTELSCATLVDIPDQVQLLIEHLGEKRRRVRREVLKCLQMLADKGAHLWPKTALDKLTASLMEQQEFIDEQSDALKVILSLTKCPVTCHTLLEDPKTLEMCTWCVISIDNPICCPAFRILTSLVLYCNNENVPPPEEYLTMITLHSDALIFNSMLNDSFIGYFSQYLHCCIQLSERNEDFGRHFTEFMSELLADEIEYPVKHKILIVEALGALNAQHYVKQKAPTIAALVDPQAEAMESDPTPQETLFKDLVPDLLRKLDQTSADQTQLIEILSTVILQSMIGFFLAPFIVDLFDKVLARVSLWSRYRVARSASRYGQHYLAAKIYSQLAGAVALEKFHFYLVALAQISKAECMLDFGIEFEELDRTYATYSPAQQVKDNLSGRLDNAIGLYWKAHANLKASSSIAHPHHFQAEYVKLRAIFLESLFGIVIARNTMYVTPPPAIAQQTAQNSRDHLQKFGHVTNQLRKAVKTLKLCEDSYGRLYKTAFDADPCTLEHLEIAQHLCAVLGHSIETVCFISPSELPIPPTSVTTPETTHFLNNCLRVVQELRRLPAESGTLKTITIDHLNVVMTQARRAALAPFCLPRLFFQTLQSTSIKLSVNPQPRTPGEPIVVQPGSNLVVKVEGVVQSGTRTPRLKPYREIEAVQLTLVSQLQTPRPPTDLKNAGGDTVQLSQTVRPHRDFLQGSFLLALNNTQVYMGNTISFGGQWQVTLEACVIDANGVSWNTGPKHTLIVRVPEDPKQNVMPSTSMRRF